MRKLDIKLSLEVNTNASKTWDIIGPNFLNISHWSRGVLKSWNDDSLSPKYENAPAGGRHCEVVGFGKLDEKIIHYNYNKFEISWSAEGEKFPKFLSGLQNEVKVERIDDNNSKITSNITANLSGIMSLLMGSYLKKNFTKLISGFLKDWKTYAETGEISETKKRESAK
jgi:hypothetical protein